MKENKGITLISLVITIIIMLILAAVTINVAGGEKNMKKAKENNKLFELQELQEAVLETYIKYKQTGNESYLVGTICEETELLQYQEQYDGILSKDINGNTGKINYSNYRKLDDQEKLNSLGIQDSEDYYIVNYITGEVFNYTSKTLEDGTVLYVNIKE